jgi:hypothetical protein
MGQGGAAQPVRRLRWGRALAGEPARAMIRFVARWEAARRYYELYEGEDLFGQAVLVQVWGGKGSRRGGARTWIGTAEQIDELKRHTARRRQQRGYTRAPG